MIIPPRTGPSSQIDRPLGGPVAPPDAWIVERPEAAWSTLDAAAKRERILCAAGRLFSREGLDASMPSVAEAAGAGVASVYRQFPSKRDLLAALVCRRLGHIEEQAWQAVAQTGGRWEALRGLLVSVVDWQAADDFLGVAWQRVADHPDVVAATTQTFTALEVIVDAARREGRLRADAEVRDVRVLLAATRAVRELDEGAAHRLLQLVIDGLRAIDV